MTPSEFADKFITEHPNINRVYSVIEDLNDNESIIEYEWPERNVLSTYYVDGDLDTANLLSEEIDKQLEQRGVKIVLVGYLPSVNDN